MNDGPPRTEAELLARAGAWAGLPIGALADALGARPPRDLTRDKGWVGQLLESALGATASNRAEPDFTELGVEMKTVPVDARGRPRESTFVTTAAYADLLGTAWEASPVCHKTRRILWVPVESDEHVPIPARRLGQATLWSPSAADDEAFAGDWAAFRAAARTAVDALDGRIGRVLQLRPKGRDGRARTEAHLEDGRRVWAKPLGFYLRRTLTASIFEHTYIVDG